MWIKKLTYAGLLTVALAGVLAIAPAAKANSIQISGVTTTLNAGVWTYAYSMSLTAGNSLSATDPNGSSEFIFYDVYGLTGPQATFAAGTTAVSDWNIAVENTSGTWAAGLSSLVSQGGTNVANDLANVPNVRYQYVGRRLCAHRHLRHRHGRYLFDQCAGLYGQYAARWIGIDGNTQVNSESPLQPGPTTAAVPVPAAAWTGLSMLAGLGFFYRA